MALDVDVTIDNPEPAACPTDFAELVALLRDLISATVSGDFAPYVLGATTPTVDQQGYVWHRLDGDGRPMGTFVYYDGQWRRQNSGRPGQVSYYSGAPGDHFDGTGKGIVGGEWDGWALMNGQNGTENLSDKFIVGGHMDNSGGQTGYGSDEWRTMVSGSLVPTGGAKEHEITADNLPPLDVSITGHTLDSGANHASKKIIYDDDYNSGNSDEIELVDYGAETEELKEPVPTLPPFFALAIVQFIGYD